jgi:hypothetical protein
LRLDYAGHHTSVRTATNPGSTWLFPGRRANRPLRPEYLATLIHRLGSTPSPSGVPPSDSTWCTCPPRSSPTHSGYHRGATTRLAAQAGTT